MNNRDVASAFGRGSLKANAKHMYVAGDTVYSYGSHFPIARRYQGVVLFTTANSSTTTAHHKSHVQQALHGETVFYVDDVKAESKAAHQANVTGMIDRAASHISDYEKARLQRTKSRALALAVCVFKDAERYAQKFGCNVSAETSMVMAAAEAKLQELGEPEWMQSKALA